MTLADWDDAAAAAADRPMAPAHGGGEGPSPIDLALIILFAPPILAVCAVVASLIWLEHGGPVLFRHERLGRGGRAFTCFKFRTMRCGSEAGLEALLRVNPRLHHQWTERRKLPGDPRATPLGAILRRLSLDELPQLINVLRGEMALVGPRPIVDAERPRYGRRYAALASIRPGITGLWQVSGRSRLSYRRRVALDLAYVRRRSCAFDAVILLRTVPAVLLGRGAA